VSLETTRRFVAGSFVAASLFFIRLLLLGVAQIIQLVLGGGATAPAQR
jgi:hypothetical protein